MRNPFRAVPLETRLARMLCGYHSCHVCGDHPSLWASAQHCWLCSACYLTIHPPLQLARRRLLNAYPGLARRISLDMPTRRAPACRS
jgi:hypothetical protein